MDPAHRRESRVLEAARIAAAPPWLIGIRAPTLKVATASVQCGSVTNRLTVKRLTVKAGASRRFVFSNASRAIADFAVLKKYLPESAYKGTVKA